MSFSISILGASGRVGSRIARLIQDERAFGDFRLVGELDSKTDFSSGISQIRDSQGLIDFSSHDVLAKWLKKMEEEEVRVPLVSGTTGWTDETWKVLKDYSEKAPVLWASNMSLGANLLFDLAQQASKVLRANGFDPEIFEIHHRNKKDAPSGTAKTLAESVGEGVEIQSIRAGDVVGDHTVYFFGPDERLELRHQAQDRNLFARGALIATRWLLNSGEKSGLYSFQDVLKSMNEAK